MIDDEAQGAAARRDDEAAAQRARTGRTGSRAGARAQKHSPDERAPELTRRERKALARPRRRIPYFDSAEEAAAWADRKLARLRERAGVPELDEPPAAGADS